LTDIKIHGTAKIIRTVWHLFILEKQINESKQKSRNRTKNTFNRERMNFSIYGARMSDYPTKLPCEVKTRLGCIHSIFPITTSL
jgi:hypothetical protein